MFIDRLTGACTRVDLDLLPRCLPDLPLSTMTTVHHADLYDGYYWVVLGGDKAKMGIWINAR